ncbi:MAG: hypothetical protein M3379_04075 [Acidobacteriota bacterium]|nr:hypothetical protein [Acidobacteriota bacterium]
MDVNGTRFHLIKGAAGWQRCSEEGQALPGDFSRLHVEQDSEALTLDPQLVLFVSARGQEPLDLSARRGASPDRFGNWYWIAADGQSIFWRPTGSKKSRLFWSQNVARPPAPSDKFAPAPAPARPLSDLRGLAVTTNHYLVVGDRSARGLFVFDLHAVGAPLRLLFPEAADFEPFDIAAAPRGGVWVLDRANKTYWGLDRNFCVLSEGAAMSEIEPEEREVFHAEGGAATVRPARLFPLGFALPAEVENPVAIEAVPDGSVLILDSPAYLYPSLDPPPPSRVLRLRGAAQEGAGLELAGDVHAVEEQSESKRGRLEVVAYDFAFVPDEGEKTKGTLYAVEREGNQAFGFGLNFDASPNLSEVATDFLPMHYFGSRAIVADRGAVYYDVVAGDTSNDRAVRWTKLQSIDEQRYETDGVLISYKLDGKERDCLWHRLFLDACLPPETSVAVYTRAADDSQLLESVEWQREPELYLRGAGAEVPFYDPFPQYEADEVPEGAGTWELLFQRARGRFLQLRLVLTGNGRATPKLHALRAYYPRFSYPKNYLPGVYLTDPGSASFLERMLANEEGFYTEIEGKIGGVSALFDARSAPPDALDWLASWVGIALDPLWADLQKRREEQVRAGLPAKRRPLDRRRLFIRYTRKLYERRGTPSGIRFALILLLDPCLEVTLYRLKRAAVRKEQFAVFREELESYGLVPPDEATTEEEFEDLLYDYVLSPRRPSKIRVVERYRTRGGRRFQEGDASAGGDTPSSAADAPDAYAHQFSVLVPEELTSEEEAMVARVAELEKPAHTQFDVRRYWDFFRVGLARLGVDTALGAEGSFAETLLGQSYLAEGYLYPPHPFDVAERLVSDRDTLGDAPSL